MKQRLIVPILLLSGACGPVPTSNEQPIHIATTPASAHCTLKNNLGSWQVDSTPADIPVTRSFSPLSIHCDAGTAGTASITLTARKRTTPHQSSSLVDGGPSILDIGTGAEYEYTPDAFTLTLHP